MLSYAIYAHFIVKELYVEEYDTINWPACRNKVSSADMYAPHSKLANTLFSVLTGFAPNVYIFAVLQLVARGHTVCLQTWRRWQEENREAIESNNRWFEEHGLPFAEYRR